LCHIPPCKKKKDKGDTFDRQVCFNQNTMFEGIQANSVQWDCAGGLIGAADFLWAAAVLHVLSKADCEKFVTSAHLLLKPGGTFYGWTVGNREAGEWHTTPDGKANRYLHSAVITLSVLSLFHFTVCVFACLPACCNVWMYDCPAVCLPATVYTRYVCLRDCLTFCLSVCLFVVCLYTCLSVCTA